MKGNVLKGLCVGVVIAIVSMAGFVGVGCVWGDRFRDPEPPYNLRFCDETYILSWEHSGRGRGFIAFNIHIRDYENNTWATDPLWANNYRRYFNLTDYVELGLIERGVKHRVIMNTFKMFSESSESIYFTIPIKEGGKYEKI